MIEFSLTCPSFLPTNSKLPLFNFTMSPVLYKISSEKGDFIKLLLVISGLFKC